MDANSTGTYLAGVIIALMVVAFLVGGLVFFLIGLVLA